MEAGTIRANGVELAYLTAGDHGPLALCLHGFPDTAHTWRYLLPRLAGAGYRVVAPFLRGYAPSAISADGYYQAAAHAADALALHETLGGDGDAVIVGHDWGALIAYGAAVHEPGRWRRVVGMAVPPGEAVASALLGDLDQLQRSWYMFLFQHPLADLLVAAADHALIARFWAQWSPGYDASVDIANAREALGAPENIHAALGSYRAALGDGPRDPALEELQAATSAVPPQPTLYLHGRDDGCVGVSVAEAAAASAPEHCRTRIIDGAGHFVHLEQPDIVNDEIMEFLA